MPQKREVIKHSRTPTTLPVTNTIAMWLFLDRIKAPQWVWGVAGTIYVVFWLLMLANIFFFEETKDVAFIDEE